jgi:hypothetical protein
MAEARELLEIKQRLALLETRFRAEKKRLLEDRAADQEVGSAPSNSPPR